jgi:hypothetical protein
MSEKEVAARELARRHFAVEPGMSRIFTIIDGTVNEELPEVPIKLLEVNDATVPFGVMPLYFAPAPATGIPFPSVIVEVTPDEFRQIESNHLHLPTGWSIGAELLRQDL